MNRILFAIMLAGTGFTTVAIGQTMPPPPPGDDMAAGITRDDTLARADKRFDRMDANRDGKLTADEVPARPMAPPPAADAATPPPPPAGGNRLFARLDANGDGAVDHAEYRAWAARRFDRVDANHDGTIDAAERQAARDAMGAMGRGGATPPPPNPNAGQ